MVPKQIKSYLINSLYKILIFEVESCYASCFMFEDENHYCVILYIHALLL